MPPTQVNLHPTSTQEPVSNFVITWEPKDHNSGTHYSVAVAPAPPYGPTNTTNSSVSVSLELNTQYIVTITQNAGCSREKKSSFALCKYLTYKINFIMNDVCVIGCPLFTAHSVDKFIVYLNGTMTAHFQTNNRSEIMTCYSEFRKANIFEAITTTGNI